nr:MAG TPA: hypothetical protein [Caudoviricetes sp.]DAG07428.1 MAG TPA: hypothetical protein [Bacteriophage sp.]DAQ34990.1 MAG TPA: hypothetical protein [Bacteriophage sp.]DAR53332.1 MAG TPA: hypothetical protein [Caudoviricetes sp.]
MYKFIVSNCHNFTIQNVSLSNNAERKIFKF